MYFFQKKKRSYHLFKSIQQSEAFFWPSGWNLHSVAFSLFSSLFRCLPSSSCAQGLTSPQTNPPNVFEPRHRCQKSRDQLRSTPTYCWSQLHMSKKKYSQTMAKLHVLKTNQTGTLVPVPFPRRQPHDCSRLISAEPDRSKIGTPESHRFKRHFPISSWP